MTRVSTSIRCFGVAAVVFVVSACFAGELQAASGVDPRFTHVVWKEQPARRATIVWVTGERGDEHAVHYDTQPRDGDTAAYAHRVEAERTVAEYNERAYFHHATLTDLHPSSTYHFVVTTDGRVSKEWKFETAPADDRPFSLLYGGDSRSNRENRRRVNRRIGELFESNDDLIGFVHGGDYVVSGMVWKQWKGWLEDWKLTRTDDGQLLPIVPGRGNHEFSIAKSSDDTDNYNGLFGHPGGKKRDYWTTRFGSQVAVITLDTNATMGGRQRDWLKSQLETLTDTRRWIVANYHRPAYPAVKSPGAARTHWVPLFERYDIDLVCESDGHVLKRTVPILDGERDSDGVVYVGEGGLGVPQRTPESDRWYLREPGMATSAHHVQLLHFGSDELTYRAITVDGNVVDRASFEPAREGSPVPLEVESVRTPERSRLHLVFSKGVVAGSIGDPSQYTVEPSIEIDSARPHGVRDRVIVLELDDELDEETTYRLRVRGVEDHLGHTLEDGTSVSFQFERLSAPEASDAEGNSSKGDAPSEPPERAEAGSEGSDSSPSSEPGSKRGTPPDGCATRGSATPLSIVWSLLGLTFWMILSPRRRRRSP